MCEPTVVGCAAKTVGSCLERVVLDAAPLRDGEVRVGVTHCGVCHTDVHAIDNDFGVCGASVSWAEPTASDECCLDTLTSPHAPGDVFPVGTTTVTYTAKDCNGTDSTCSFDVTVLDVEPPTVAFAVTPPNPDHDWSANFRWTATDNNLCTALLDLEYRKRLDGGAWTAWSLDTSTIAVPLSEDWHTLEVEARDGAGNISPPISHTWYRATYGVTPPDSAGGGGEVAGVGGGSCFFDLDHCLDGAGGDTDIFRLNAIYEVGEPIIINLEVTDDADIPVLDANVSATFAEITLVDGEEKYPIVGYYPIPHQSLGLYLLTVLTDGAEDEVLELAVGHYIVWIGFNDGTQIEQRIQIVEPSG